MDDRVTMNNLVFYKSPFIGTDNEVSMPMADGGRVLEPRKMFGGGVVGNLSFGEFFGTTPGPGSAAGYYEEPQQFVDAAEEVTTEQPATETAASSVLNPAQQKLVDQELLQYTDLGYPPQGLVSKYMNSPGTIELPILGQIYGGGVVGDASQYETQPTTTETQTETAPVDRVYSI